MLVESMTHAEVYRELDRDRDTGVVQVTDNELNEFNELSRNYGRDNSHF